MCPNCRKRIEQALPACPYCNVDFGAGSAWKPIDPKKRKTYLPFQVPLVTRKWSMVIALALIVYGVVGIYAGQMYVPGRRGAGMAIRGIGIAFMAGAIVCAVLNLMAVVFQHGDPNDNEVAYRDFRRGTQMAAWILFVLALLSSCARTG